jgi:hypothetical protein
VAALYRSERVSCLSQRFDLLPRIIRFRVADPTPEAVHHAEDGREGLARQNGNGERKDIGPEGQT